MPRKVKAAKYKHDPFYPRVCRAVHEILKSSDDVAPVEVFLRMGMLTRKDLESWRQGSVPYLERVLQGSLPKLSRALRVLALHARDRGLKPQVRAYRRSKGRGPLRFTKTDDPNLEEAYARHFVAGKRRAASPEPAAAASSAVALEPDEGPEVDALLDEDDPPHEEVPFDDDPLPF